MGEKKYHYTRAECETIIRFAEDNEQVSVYTCNSRMQRRLKAFGLVPVKTDLRGGLFFEFNGRKKVSIGNPFKKRVGSARAFDQNRFCRKKTAPVSHIPES